MRVLICLRASHLGRILKKMKSVMNSGAYLVPDGVQRHLEGQLVPVPEHLQPELEVARQHFGKCHCEFAFCGDVNYLIIPNGDDPQGPVKHREIFPFAVPAGRQDKSLGHILATTDQPELISNSHGPQRLIVSLIVYLTPIAFLITRLLQLSSGFGSPLESPIFA
jgi:hypothetical protein